MKLAIIIILGVMMFMLVSYKLHFTYILFYSSINKTTEVTHIIFLREPTIHPKFRKRNKNCPISMLRQFLYNEVIDKTFLRYCLFKFGFKDASTEGYGIYMLFTPCHVTEAGTSTDSFKTIPGATSIATFALRSSNVFCNSSMRN